MASPTGSGGLWPRLGPSIGKDGSVTKEAGDLHNANGLVMSNDGNILYLVETEDNRIIDLQTGDQPLARKDKKAG